jgi:tetratricopeptide (TPR) repeat protein
MAELRRLNRWHVRLRKKSKQILTRTGPRIFLGVMYPITWIYAWWKSRRYERARQLALKGSKMISERGSSAKAEQMLAEAVRLAPDEGAWWNDYGIALGENGKTDEAVKALRMAIKKGAGRENEYVFWYSLAYRCYLSGRVEEANEAFDQVVALGPLDDELTRQARSIRGYAWR